MDNTGLVENQNKIKINEGKKYLAFVFLFLGLIVADQFSKFYAGNVFRNSVFAFSLPLPVWIIYFIYALVLTGMAVYCLKSYKAFGKPEIFSWLLIFAGALSNIGERLVLGYVRDWIRVLTGIFNFADIFIIVGIVLLLLNFNIEKIEQN